MQHCFDNFKSFSKWKTSNICDKQNTHWKRFMKGKKKDMLRIWPKASEDCNWSKNAKYFWITELYSALNILKGDRKYEKKTPNIMLLNFSIASVFFLSLIRKKENSPNLLSKYLLLRFVKGKYIHILYDHYLWEINEINFCYHFCSL